MGNLIRRIRAAWRTRSDSRKIRTRFFSGRAVLSEIGRREYRGKAVLSLLYKNGLILTLGEEGIMDFQARDFNQFLESPGIDNRNALAMLHKIVLKSLIRYMVHPHIDGAQRERAAEAASKLYLAEVEATTDWLPGPAAAMVHGGFGERSLARP